LRVGVGLTQKEISAKLEIPQSTVSKVESGTRKIDLIELRLWCNVCGLTLSEFVEKFESNLDEKE
jgi:transcriptional regulator with XRE-family HTH domain